MAKKAKKSNGSENWHFMVDAAKRGLEAQGYSLSRQPGRGLSNIWNADRDGTTHSISIRTTRDRSIAFPPLKQGTKWKTLDDVDLVAVSSVDSKENPKNVEVYIFPAAEVQKRFNAAYQARKKAGQAMRDDFGMWVSLDTDPRDIPARVGSGIAEQFKPIATYSIQSLKAEASSDSTSSSVQAAERVPARVGSTIAEVMALARARVAEIAGVSIDAVKLDLKIEY